MTVSYYSEVMPSLHSSINGVKAAIISMVTHHLHGKSVIEQVEEAPGSGPHTHCTIVMKMGIHTSLSVFTF